MRGVAAASSGQFRPVFWPRFSELGAHFCGIGCPISGRENGPVSLAVRLSDCFHGRPMAYLKE